MKSGYKQTEAGVIPDDWQVLSVFELADKQKSRFDDGDWVEAEHITDKGIRLIQTGSIGVGEYIEKEAKKYIYESSFDRLRCKELRVGDVLICRLAEPAGRACILPDIGEEKIITSVDVTIFRPDDDKFDRGYLTQYFSTPQWFDAILEQVGGTTHKRIARSALGSTQVPLPATREEQSAIATALSDVDALLAGLDKIIAKKRDLKQAAMQQLLTGKTRLPGFTQAWEVKRLDALADIYSGGTPSTSIAKFWDGGILWCTPTDITKLNGSKYLASTSRTISQDGLSNSSTEMIPSNSVVMTSRASIGECAINSVPVTTNQGFKNFVPFETTDAEFLYYLLQTQKQGFIRLCAGSTFLEIGKTQLASYEVRLPATKEEQAAIAEVLGDMDAELAALEKRREKARRLKQGMMQELLTGRTRLMSPAVRPASNVVLFKNPAAKSVERKAPAAFQRSVFAAEIVDRLHNEPTFGHVKFEKLIYLAEHLCKVDIDSHYHRDAAGPYDNRALRSIDSQMEKSKWFKAHKVDRRYQYVPMEKRGDHKQYFDRYFAGVSATFDKVIDTFRSAKTEQCEIVATLYEAWRDLLAKNVDASEDVIVDQVLNHWHDDKRRIPEDRWSNALVWMREKGFVPEGAV